LSSFFEFFGFAPPPPFQNPGYATASQYIHITMSWCELCPLRMYIVIVLLTFVSLRFRNANSTLRQYHKQQVSKANNLYYKYTWDTYTNLNCSINYEKYFNKMTNYIFARSKIVFFILVNGKNVAILTWAINNQKDKRFTIIFY